MPVDEDIYKTKTFWSQQMAQRESSFYNLNTLFILLETLIILTYVPSLSTNHPIIFKLLLIAGIFLSIFWWFMNIQYFLSYIKLMNKCQKEVEVLKIALSPGYKSTKSDFGILYFARGPSFWAFIVMPLFFIGFQMILFVYT